MLLTGHVGFKKPLGHVDFYPNGGTFQFGCPPFFADAISNILDLGIKHIYIVLAEYIESLLSYII